MLAQVNYFNNINKFDYFNNANKANYFNNANKVDYFNNVIKFNYFNKVNTRTLLVVLFPAGANHTLKNPEIQYQRYYKSYFYIDFSLK